MSQRAFIASLILLAALVALSATPFPGVLIAFAAWLVAGLAAAVPMILIGGVLKLAGIPVTDTVLYWVLGAVYALLVPAAGFRVWRQLQQQNAGKARRAGLELALLVAVPSIIWISMKQSWPL
ncbi:hypothetical protein EN802_27025 [bacterium M00.F.Ca.ET.159.01.1.1]|nr:hypothetical protein EN873_03115 [bacterium M00.F.Ca.ET.230.01.1.1]TGT68549.1 hypothetical protein EN802_27025 [bacterium M00.F.Ca.ET.159.01.1.1]TGT80383.1 hypothetical protein EN800_26365 [bacterium M00.F.Ca.ET.157.01.1.1]